MNTAKKVFYTVAVSMAAGAVIGMLFAPDEGAETRRKIRQLKRKFSCPDEAIDNETDHETLQALSHSLSKQLDRINERLERQ